MEIMNITSKVGECMTIEEVLSNEERQIFDRKSINIEPKALAVPLIAFANADGGTIAIGISDKTRRIEGTDFEVQKLNELLRVPYDFCEPSVPVQIEKIPCIDFQGKENHVVLMHIEPSMVVHANQADEAFLRVGDKSKKLSFEERTQLMYDKGERYFEDKAVPDATVEDLDMGLVKSYIDKIGYGKSGLEYLKENKGFLKIKQGKELVSGAAILLFGKNPQLFFPRARIRFIRYEGNEEKSGTEMNVIKDVIFEGTILKQINDAIAYLNTQVKEKTYLGQDGLFVTEEEYPKFVRQEIIVNAVTHRSYSISGTEIQIKMFDNRIVVESPGKLPGLVRTNNIRYTHFSRNPRIAEFLKAYKFVKEYGEGVDRMYNELESAGLHEPEYFCNAFILQTVIYNKNYNNSDGYLENTAIQGTNPAIEERNPTIAEKNPAIEERNPSIQSEKLSIEKLKKGFLNKNYRENTKDKIIAVYNDIDTNQIFGAPEIERILDCSPTTAKEIMRKIRDMEVVVEVKGSGKGKYRFIYENEAWT